MFEQITKATTTRKLHYIPGGDGLAAIYVENGQKDTMYYIHKDHLGSFDVVTGESGNVVERMSFDPWGRRRNPTNWTYSGVSTSYTFERGFTGHEHIDEFGLVNMNGRVYDAVLGRFLSPDKIVQFPSFTQSYNRYSYVFNNPLRFIDPSGWEGEEDDEGKNKEEQKDHQDGGGVTIIIISPAVTAMIEHQWNMVSAEGFFFINYMSGEWSLYNGSSYSGNTKQVSMAGPNGTTYVWSPMTYGGKQIHESSATIIWDFYDPESSWREIGSENNIYIPSNYTQAIKQDKDRKNWKFVAVTGAIDIDILTGGGSDISPAGAGVILKGKDKGKKFSYTDCSHPLESFGVNLSAGAEAYFWFYNGDISNFTILTFNGNRNEFELGYGLISSGFTWSEKDPFGSRLYGIKVEISTPSAISVFGITGGYNYGKTIVH